MIREMMREEWRMHARLYGGRSFALFPVSIFVFAFLLTWVVVQYSTVSLHGLAVGLFGVGCLMGATVGMVGFSSRDVMRNILGPVNFLVYSGRTLPVSRFQLLVAFLVKDLLFYVGLFLLPISLGVLLPTGFGVWQGVVWMHAAFVAGIVVVVVVARLSIRLPVKSPFGFGHDWLSPVADKSIVDVFRSTGGLFKVVFTLGVLTGTYWFIVLYFPAMQVFLSRPLLSYSVLLGTVSVSIYNWVNRFDDPGDYTYLPIDAAGLRGAKGEAFLVLALPLVTVFVLVSSLLYPVDLAQSVVAAAATTVYTAGISVSLLGLDPNTRMYHTGTFLRFVAVNGVVVVPLLILSTTRAPVFALVFNGVLGVAFLGGAWLTRHR